MNAEKTIETIRKSELAGKFASLRKEDQDRIVSDYRLCSGAVSLIVALWNDKRLSDRS